MTAHPAVTRTWATLRIWGKTLDPETVTLHLGMGPSDSFKVGDHFGKGGSRVRKDSHWSLTSEENFTSTELEAHIEWILERIEPVRDQLEKIMQEPGVQADLFCFWESESVNAGIVFSPSIMRRTAALNLTLGVDIYFAF